MTRLSIIVSLLIIVLGLFLMPLRFAISHANIADLSAKNIEGTIWTGHIGDAHYRQFPIGNVKAGLSFSSLLSANPKISFERALSPGYSQISGAIGSSGIDAFNGQLDMKDLLAPLPIDAIIMRDAGFEFNNENCIAASGKVRALMRINIDGTPLSRDLEGPLECVSGKLRAALKGKTGSERLTIDIDAVGAYSADIILLGNYPISAEYEAQGFRKTSDGIGMSLKGSL